MSTSAASTTYLVAPRKSISNKRDVADGSAEADAEEQRRQPLATHHSSSTTDSRTKKAVARDEEEPPVAASAVSVSTASNSSTPQQQANIAPHVPHPGQPDDISPNGSAHNSPMVSPLCPPRRLVVPAKMSSSPMVALSAGHFSMQGIRPEMEDRVTLLQHPEFNQAANLAPDGQSRSFFAVFDGHGGDVSAEYCRQHVHNNLMLSEAFQAGRLSEGLKAALVKTEDDFCAACRRINLLTSSGTTAITAYVQADQLVVANVGDSRAVLCRNGRALDASIDHKPGRKEERARIEALGGRVGITEEDAFRTTSRPCPCLWACVSAGRPLRVFPGGLSVSRTIGDISMKNAADGSSGGSSQALVSSEPEMWESKLTLADEFLILACDGTWDVMSSSSAVDFVRGVLFRSNNDPGVASKALANEAFRRGSTDNISVIVVVFNFPEDANNNNNASRGGSTASAAGAAAHAAAAAASAPSQRNGK